MYAFASGVHRRFHAPLRLVLALVFAFCSVLHSPRPVRVGDARWSGVAPQPGRALSAQAAAGWTAYNDCQYLSGQPSSGITTVGCDAISAGNALVRSSDGSATGVTFDVAINSVTPQNSSSTWGTLPTAGDAVAVFPSALINMVGGVRITASTGYVRLTFKGLSPGRTYTFATTANSGNATYASRLTTFTISGMDSATNTSSAGTTTTPESTAFSTGLNTATGYIARWENINPGVDGSFVVTANSTNGAYGPAVFLLSEEAASGPAIQTTGTLTAFSTPAGEPSAEQSYAVSATNLTEDLLVTAPEGFELSVTSGGPYTDTLSLAPADGAVPATPVYVRFYRVAMGASSGAITHTSAGAYPMEMPVSGTAYGPQISITGSLVYFTAAGGSPSPVQSYHVSGSHLEGDVAVTAPAGFEISTTADSGFGGSLTLTPSAGTLDATRVYARLNRAVAGSSSGSILHESSGAETIAVAVTGAAYTWRAYNDCSVSGVANPARTNEILCSTSAPAYALRAYDSAMILPASVAISASSTSAATTGAIPNAGTDAHASFYGMANITGNVRMTTPTASVVLTFTGLNPEQIYTFAATANRASASDSCNTQVTVEDIDNSVVTNASTNGAQVSDTAIPGDTTVFDGGDNTVNGIVARWTGIQPGADGDFTVRFRVLDGQAYGPSVFMLAEESNSVPNITTTGALAGFTTTRNLPSTAQSYTVSGRNLGGGITVTAPTGFQVSTASDTGFASSLVLPAVNGAVAETTLYARFAPSAGGSFSGEILHSSPSAAARALIVSGEASENEIPALPDLVSPGDSTTGVASSALLEVSVYDPNQDALEVTFYGRPAGDSGAAFALIGTANAVPSGGSASITWEGLAYSTQYEWYASASDGSTPVGSPIWRFTTQPMPNQPPVIQEGETVSVTMSEEGAPVAFALSLHATDANPGDTLTWSVAFPPRHGLAVAPGTGSFVNVLYWPSDDYHGNDSFIVQVADTAGALDTIRVDVTVIPVNDPPVIVSQVPLATAEDVALVIDFDDLIVTDVDNTYPDGFSLSILPGYYYTASGHTITPDPDMHGAILVPVSVHDGTDSSAVVNLLIEVQPVNDPPVASPQLYIVDEDLPADISLMAWDVENDPIQYEILTTPSLGVLSGTAPELIYTPYANSRGSDSFTFRVFDGEAYSPPAEISVIIIPETNLPPVIAEGEAVSVDMSEDGPPITLTLHAGDPNRADGLHWSIETLPNYGTAVAEGDGAEQVVTYVPYPHVHGSDSFIVQVTDNEYATDTITINIDIVSVNDLPVAHAQTVTTDEDTAVGVALSGFDVEFSPLTYEIVDPPAFGLLSGDAPHLTYTPHANVSGADSFTFRVFDGEDYSLPASVTINITEVNDAPVIAEGELVSVDMSLDGFPTAFSLTLHASDVDENAVLNWFIQSPPAHGIASVSGTGTSMPVQYTPTPGYSGYDYFIVRVEDGRGGQDIIGVDVSVILNPTITAGSLSPFTARPGKISLVQSYTVSGFHLISPVTVTAPAGFEISLFSDTLFTDKLFLAIDNGVLEPTQIYVRYRPDHEGDVTAAILHESSCAETVSVPVSGSAEYIRFYLPLIPLSRTP